jgi:hypothetical protein
MRVGMADAGGADADQNVTRADGRKVDLLFLERRTDRGKADSFHCGRRPAADVIDAIIARTLAAGERLQKANRSR